MDSFSKETCYAGYFQLLVLLLPISSLLSSLGSDQTRSGLGQKHIQKHIKSPSTQIQSSKSNSILAGGVSICYTYKMQPNFSGLSSGLRLGPTRPQSLSQSPPFLQPQHSQSPIPQHPSLAAWLISPSLTLLSDHHCFTEFCPAASDIPNTSTPTISWPPWPT